MRSPPILISILSAGAVFCAGLALTVEARRSLRVERRGAAVAVASGAALNIQRQLSKSLAAAHALAALVRQGRGDIDFEPVAEEMLHLYGGISNLQLQPGGVIRRVYPLAGNESALGLDLLHDPLRRPWALATIESRQLTLDGPFPLRQGGMALVGRIAVFLPRADGSERFWGFAACALKLDDFLRASDVKSLEEQGYGWSLTRADSAEVFAASDPPPGGEPVRVRLRVIQGEWSLAAAPRKGWTSPVAEAWHLVLSFAIAVGVGLLLHRVLQHPEQLRCEVLARTQELDRANALLHGELAERHRAEAKLQAAREHLRRILEAASEGIWVADAQGRTEFANARAAEMFGMSTDEMLGRPFVDLVPENLRQQAAADLETLAAGRTAQREMKVLRADGSEVWLILSTSILRDAEGAVAGTVAVFMDVTAQRRAQEELEQAHKLEAVGRLASGIAHEINTPIQYIGDNTTFLDEAFTGLASLLQQHRSALAGGTLDGVREPLERAARDLDLDYLLEQIPRTLVRTLEGVKRVATIVRAMKEFAHPDQLEMIATDLNRTITATLEVSRNEYRYVADVVMNLGDVPPVTCHPGELSQVFLNLIVNAAHAIEDVVKGTQGKGTIGVATRLEGDEVVIAISDTGGGIPPAVREKIFEPFYTTKEVGRGTGQGLAIARNVVRKHRGSITFTTAIGKGTTFFIRVPIEPLKRETARAA